MADVRVPITWARPLGPVFALIGARHDSWITVGEHQVEARMGPLARARFPRRLIVDARPMDWPLRFGFGIRIYGRHKMGLVGRPRGVVELHLSEPVRVRALVPMKMDRLAVSVADPRRLLASLRPTEKMPMATKAPRATRRRADARKAAPAHKATTARKAAPARKVTTARKAAPATRRAA